MRKSKLEMTSRFTALFSFLTTCPDFFGEKKNEGRNCNIYIVDSTSLKIDNKLKIITITCKMNISGVLRRGIVW